MAGYPPEYFSIKGFSITARRSEDHFIRVASSDNAELNVFINKHIKDSNTEDKGVFRKLLENAVDEYLASKKQSLT